MKSLPINFPKQTFLSVLSTPNLSLEMKGVSPSLGPQLMAEIGDVTRFTRKGAITAFAGADSGVNESGSYEQKSVPTFKRSSEELRKTLFQTMDVLIKPCLRTILFISSPIRNEPGVSLIMFTWPPELINFYVSTVVGYKNSFHPFQNPNNSTTLFQTSTDVVLLL